MHGIYAHFDDLDLDARSQWVGKCKQSALNYLPTKQAITISITLATTVGHFVLNLHFENIYIWHDNLVVLHWFSQCRGYYDLNSFCDQLG